MRGRRLLWHRIKCKYNWIIGSTVIRYSFGIVNWHQEELQKLERKQGNCQSFMDIIIQRWT